MTTPTDAVLLRAAETILTKYYAPSDLDYAGRGKQGAPVGYVPREHAVEAIAAALQDRAGVGEGFKLVPVNNDPCLKIALQCAIGHLEHMAAWIGQQKPRYSFEGLGEDMPAMRAALLSAAPASPVDRDGRVE